MAEMTPQQEDLLDLFKQAIFNERKHAHRKHGKTSMEQADLLAHRRASILTEEAVECAKALNDYEHHSIQLFSDTISRPVAEAQARNRGLGLENLDELDKELIQTAAMAYTWWANRRGDRLPVEKQAVTLAGDQYPVRINGKEYFGTIDQATGWIHIDIPKGEI